MITILGLGNILLQDEGLGVHFIRWMKGRHDFFSPVRIVDGGTLGFLLLDVVCESEYLLVIDAVKVDDKPGSMYRFTPADLSGEYLSQGAAHDASFFQVLLQAEMIQQAPRDWVIIAVVPENIQGFGLSVTPEVKDTFVEIEKQVFAELQRWGGGGRKKGEEYM